MSLPETLVKRLHEAPVGEPEWLAEKRRAGASHLETVGFPTRRDEAWKYTDMSRFSSLEFGQADSAELDQARLDALKLDIDACRLVFVDGLFNAELSDAAASVGVTVTPLSQALTGDQHGLSEQLGQLTGIDFSAFTALNTALTKEGVVVNIGKGQAIETPIYLLFISRNNASPVMSHPRILVHCEAESEATLIEHYVGEQGAANLTNVVTEIQMSPASRLSHYKLQEASQSEYHVASIQVDQRRDTNFTSHNLNLGGAVVRNDIVTDLNDENATVDLLGLFFGQDRQHIDNHTKVNHNAPRTYSNENYKGILDGRARGVFNGRVYIKRDAQQVLGYQSNANLLLSDRAEIDTKPELEIYADDVQCSHGTTTGQLDENAIFALRARGIDEQMARGLLTLAFANEVMQRIRHGALTDRVERAVAGKLPDRFNLESLVEDTSL
ncbi:Fe-S cluster assembly protein SufD [Kushneria phyllosphaerae]|uniref:FeS cluster assembly protein SufD n=1 Tax=Kushneria phyllosphaerae TaxID=2100822 RepID=A0A2R8CNQ9_9GAMM|nr:Fe-S cluster assembly protein SufD [Kushneria phyllosphaerae]SPJ34515.1 FeS cluster assembly protein SufD [Kushneria phyllosphaerae]